MHARPAQRHTGDAGARRRKAMVPAIGARSILACGLWALALAAPGCGGTGFGRTYEYEQELRLGPDASASVTINASLAALAALHGLDREVSANAEDEAQRIRALFSAPAVEVTRVSRPWRRDGRPFIQLRLQVADVRHLSRTGPFETSVFTFERDDDVVEYRHAVGGGGAAPGVEAGWTGGELVAFRVHLPSRIRFHNTTTGQVERGNILTWEQPLASRLSGEPLEMVARTEGPPILFRTLILFGISFVAALGALGAGVLWMMRRAG